MAKRPTTITYVDTQTGRVHRLDADVEAGATRKDTAASIARICGMPADRVRITGQRPA